MGRGASRSRALAARHLAVDRRQDAGGVGTPHRLSARQSHPGHDEYQAAPDAITLDNTQANQTVEILRITEEGERDPRLLDYLQKQSLIPGMRVTVQEVVEYTGVVTFKKGDKSIALGLKAARTIWVKPVT